MILCDADTNGAGDSFLGGYIAKWMQGKPMELCAKAGNLCAGYILRQVGITINKNVLTFFLIYFTSSTYILFPAFISFIDILNI
mgnify:CR=1 FL=1